MYGSYSRSLGDYAKEQAAEIRRLKNKQDSEIQKRKPRSDYDGWTARLTRACAFVWRKTFAKIGE